MFVLVFFYRAIDFVATIIFAIAGCMMVENKSIAQIVLSTFFCSFGGGLTRDVLLWKIVSKEVIPAFFSAQNLWFASTFGFLCFIQLKRRYKTWKINSGWYKWLRVAIDYAGVGQFLVSGIMRAREFGVTNLLALTFFGSITALGGGLITLILFREHKLKALRNNIAYYSTAIIFSAMVANITDLRVEVASVAVPTAFFCSVVGISMLYVISTECPKRRIKRGASFSQKIRIQLSLGALFHTMINPEKGVRRLIHIPSATGFNKYLILPKAV